MVKESPVLAHPVGRGADLSLKAISIESISMTS